MTTLYKTQCPRCQTIYPMPDEKLSQPKARANCGKCHHTFFLNAHLIANEPPPPPAPKAERPKPIINPSPIASTPATPPISAQEAVAKARAKHQADKNGQSISAKSAQTLSKLANEMPEEDGFGDDFDGLDDFLKGDVQVAPLQAATNKNQTVETGEEEAWAAKLLAEEEKKEATKAVMQAISKPSDDMSDVFGAEFDNIRVVSATASLDKKELQKRAEQRISAQSPSQEQLVRHRGIAGQLLWIVSSLAMLGLMIAQYAFFDLDNILKQHKPIEPVIHKACELLKCELPQADLTAFNHSYELQQSKTPTSTDLIGTIDNTSSSEQLYPNLKISVYGQNRFIGEFVAAPSDYLTTQQRLLGKNQGKRYMFTLSDVTPNEIARVNIEPFY